MAGVPNPRPTYFEHQRERSRWLRCEEREKRLKQKLAYQQKQYDVLQNKFEQFKSVRRQEKNLFGRLCDIVYDVNLKLEPLSRQDKNGVILKYVLRLQIIGVYPQTFSLCLLRQESSHPPHLPYRCEHKRKRHSIIEVAETQFWLDPKKHFLESDWHETYVAPQSGSFGETYVVLDDNPKQPKFQKKPYETYEQRHFFTLLTHVKMLFAARTRSVYAVGSATPATCKLLYKYYNDEHTFHRSESHDRFLDSQGNPLPLVEQGDNWYHRASGTYAASKACWEIQNKLEEENRDPTPGETQIMNEDNAKWDDHIDEMITSWMTQAKTQKSVLFNAVNQYVLNLF